jgi:hypothetical protein
MHNPTPDDDPLTTLYNVVRLISATLRLLDRLTRLLRELGGRRRRTSGTATGSRQGSAPARRVKR